MPRIMLERLTSLWDRDDRYGGDMRKIVSKHPREYVRHVYGRPTTTYTVPGAAIPSGSTRSGSKPIVPTPIRRSRTRSLSSRSWCVMQDWRRTKPESSCVEMLSGVTSWTRMSAT